LRRPLLVLPLIAASALVLAGCAGAETPTETPAPEDTSAAMIDVCEAPSGDAASAVQVSGDFGSEPTVTIDGAVSAEETEREVVIDGGEAPEGALVSVAYAFYNGTSGELIDTFGWTEGETPEYLRGGYDYISPGFAKTIGCLAPGSRVVGVIPSAEGFAEAGAQYGLADEDSVVFVADIIGDAEWTEDVPEVSGDAANPVVTLPGATPVPDLRIAVLEEGDGAAVGPFDTVTVNYQGTAWETGEIFDSSFERGQPASFQVQGVVQGFMQALVNQKVGSRVIVTMPPSLGYGNSPGHELATSTLVFLIDIVDVQPAG
jgi:FKBP-type peptidyl-prolyl cis-trans isomerase 2